MAGKHTNVCWPKNFQAPGVDTKGRPQYPGTRPDRAYAEGRQANKDGGPNVNPYVPTTDEGYAWVSGYSHGAGEESNDEKSAVQTGNYWINEAP